MTRHLVFYDGQCGVCDRAVAFLLRIDHKELFAFAPLGGESAKRLLPLAGEGVTVDLDTLILVENYREDGKRKFYFFGKAVLRICWLLGGAWSLLGVFSFLPGVLYDWKYRLIARHRNRLFKDQICLAPSQFPNRFLP